MESQAGGCPTAANGRAARPLGQPHSSRGQKVKKDKKKGEERKEINTPACTICKFNVKNRFLQYKSNVQSSYKQKWPQSDLQ